MAANPSGPDRVKQASDFRQRLLEILVRDSFQYSDTSQFKLASGKTSPYYINCKKTTYQAEAMNLIGALIFDRISALPVEGIGGLTLGADPIAFAVSMFSYQQNRPLNAFVVRKTVKEHGTKQAIEGTLSGMKNVVVVEDVVTTGQSALDAISKCEEAGLEVFKVVALVDREEGGREAILAKVPRFDALFTKTDLFNWYQDQTRKKEPSKK